VVPGATTEERMPKRRKARSKASLDQRLEGLFSNSKGDGRDAEPSGGAVPPVAPDVVSRTSSARSVVPAPGLEGTIYFVTFRLGSRLWGVPLDRVERILRMVAIIPVPEEPAWVAGAINMHGRVVPVVHLGRRLGGPVRDPGLSDRLVVVRTAEDVAALIVDEVTDVAGVPASQVVSPPEPLRESPFLESVIRRDESLVMVIDVTRLVRTGDAWARVEE